MGLRVAREVGADGSGVYHEGGADAGGTLGTDEAAFRAVVLIFIAALELRSRRSS